jgi:hypothetical protein
MNIVGLMLKAVRGTVAEGVQQMLEGAGLDSEAPKTDPAKAAPPEPAARPPVPIVEIFDAVFPQPPASPPPATDASPPPATDALPAPATPTDSSEPAEPAVQGTASDAEPKRPRAEPATETPEGPGADAVLALLLARGGSLRGFEIAEGTGIAPWWRLKDVLQGLVRDGRVTQTEEGLFSLRQGQDE